MLCIASVLCLILEDSVPDPIIEPHLNSSAIEEAAVAVEPWCEDLFFQAATYTESVMFDYDRWANASKFVSESSQRFSIGVNFANDKKDSVYTSAVFEFGSNTLSNRSRYGDLEEQVLTMGTRQLEYDTVGGLTYFSVDESSESSFSVAGGVGWIWMRDNLTLDEEITPNHPNGFF